MHARESWQRVAVGGGGAMFVGMGLGRFSYTAMVPALVEAGQVSESAAGTIGSLNLAGFLAGAFCSEMLRRAAAARGVPMRVLLRRTVWLSVLALLLSALPWGAPWLGLWRGVLGVTTGLIMVLSLALAVAAAPDDRRPRATGLVFIGVGIAICCSGVLVPWLLGFGIVWAWTGVALLGAGAGLVVQLCLAEASDPPEADDTAGRPLMGDGRWWALVAAHFLFAVGLVPHTIYWVDFIARGLGHGMAGGGLHWSVVGVFAIIGPIVATWLAERIGTGRTLVLALFCLAIGIGGPALFTVAPVVWLSTLVFGVQPGVSTLIGARTRDMGTAAEMPRMMRIMMLANGTGAAVGGLVVAALFDATGSYAAVFLLGSGALALGALLSLPRGRGSHEG